MNKMEKIKRALNNHSPALMQIPGVNGVYIGLNEADELVIRIMVEKQSKKMKESLPKQLDGFSVEIEDVGKIHPM